MSLEPLLAPIRRRLDNMIARAAVAMIDDTTTLQLAQVKLLGGVRDRCERIQQYGFTAVPLAGAEAIVLFLGGKHDHPIVIGVDDRRYRKHELQPGEVCLYTDQGDFLRFGRGGTVTLQAATKLRAETPLVDMTGSANVAGVYQVAGTQVVAGQGGTVADAVGGATIDTQARAAINALLARLRAHGLIAT